MMKQHKIPFNDSMYYENQKGWMISHSSLCELNFLTKKASIIKKLEVDFERNHSPFLSVVKHDKKFYLSSGIEGKYIGIYNQDVDEIHNIQLREINNANQVDCLLKPSLNPGIKVENYIFYSGYSYPAIVVIDTLTDDIFYIDDWILNIEKSIVNKQEFTHYFSRGYEIVDNNIYFGFACLPKLLKIDLSNMTTEIIELETDVYGISGLTKLDEKRIFITERGKSGNRCLIWNKDTLEIENQIEIDEYNSQAIDSLYPVVNCNNRFFLFPFITLFAENIYEIDIKSLSIGIKTNLSMGINKYDASETEFMQHVLVLQEDQGIIRYLSGSDLHWYEWDEKTDTTINYVIELDENEESLIDCWSDCALDFVWNGQTVPERLIPLKGFIDLVVKDKNEDLEDKEKIGDKICKLFVR